MRKSEDWARPFEFRNAYDVVGAPQGASCEEVELIAEELQSAMRMLGFPENKRRLLDRSVAILLDEEHRDHHDDRPETRLLAIQDPVTVVTGTESELGRIASRLFLGRGVSLRDFSKLQEPIEAPVQDVDDLEVDFDV
jgi:hypothetical protein